MTKCSTALTPAFVLALALTASAQERPLTTSRDYPDTVRVSFSGRLQLDYVTRSAALNEFVSSTVGSAQDSSNTFEGTLAAGFDMELSDRVMVLFEIGTRRADGGTLDPWSSTLFAEGILLREARGSIGDFLMPGLSFTLGIVPYSFDINGSGGSLFAPRNSQSFERNAINGARGQLTSAPDGLDPVGGLLTFERDAIRINVVMLPAVLEVGTASEDEAIYAVDVFYKLGEKGGRVGVILALVDIGDTAGGIAGNGGPIVTFGGGVALNGLLSNFSLSVEIYAQFGNVGEVGPTAIAAGGGAFLVEASYTFESGVVLGASLMHLSGDDNAADSDVGNFLSYEDFADLMIIEDMYFGFDWDSNLTAIKLSGQVPLSVGSGKNNLVLTAIVGSFKAAEDVGAEDGIGNELDLKARFDVTRQVSIHAAIGLLSGADIMELAGTAPDNDDSAVLFVLGADLRF